VESLNVSVAAGVCLYEAHRQRRPHSWSGAIRSPFARPAVAPVSPVRGPGGPGIRV